MSLGKLQALHHPSNVVSVSVASSIVGLFVIAYLAFYRVLLSDKGEGKMVDIANAIKIGAKAFLQKEYTYVAFFVFVMFIFIGSVTDDWKKTGVCFLIGATLSALCGYCGMLIAVEANVRTAHGAKKGLDDALKVAFGSGGVMGLSVVCMGSLGLVIVLSIWYGNDPASTRYLAGFGFGASSIALFARVGGGIYTKAADVGADLIGKVQSNIPEDDPRNPAVIADNVGDNVGDVAGMGADLFESYVGCLIACIQLAQEGTIHFYKLEHYSDLTTTSLDRNHFIALPFWVSGFGILSSIIGILSVRTNKKPDAHEIQDVLLTTIRRGIFIACVISWFLSLITCGVLFGFTTRVCWRLLGAITIGLVAGQLIGYFTEYTTSFSYKPTRSIAKKSRMGAAGVVIQGLSIGMLSTAAPVLVVFVSILGCTFLCGVYGIAIAAVGMLSTLGVTLATDAFGPVADNAGGIAEMAGLDEYVRERTDALDALGNTTAATGKGFAVGSAVLTAVALLSAYKQETGITTIDISHDQILASAIFGACLPYIFSSLVMLAVGRAASLMIEEVRRQFNTYNLLDPEHATGEPDYQQCVAISTTASIIEMLIPSVLAVLSPLFIGYLLNAQSLGGLLAGATISGFLLAVFMSNTGGAWDNAKKYIEAKHLGENKGKGSEYHKAAVVGDTVGDPLKDTSGPSLNILIKMMSLISLVFAPSFSHKAFHKWYIAFVIFIIFVLFAASLLYWMHKTGFGKIKFNDAPTDQNDTDNNYHNVNEIKLSGNDKQSNIQTNDFNQNDNNENENENENETLNKNKSKNKSSRKHKTHQKIQVDDESDKDSNEKVESEVVDNTPAVANGTPTDKGFTAVPNKYDE